MDKRLTRPEGMGLGAMARCRGVLRLRASGSARAEELLEQAERLEGMVAFMTSGA